MKYLLVDFGVAWIIGGIGCMLLGNDHPERSVLVPVDVGLIAAIPMVTCAAFLLWYQYKQEQMELEETFGLLNSNEM